MINSNSLSPMNNSIDVAAQTDISLIIPNLTKNRINLTTNKIPITKIYQITIQVENGKYL